MKVFTKASYLQMHESPHIGEKIYRCYHNEIVCIHSIHHQRNEIIESVMNLILPTYMGMSSHSHYQKIHVRYHSGVKLYVLTYLGKPSLILLPFNIMRELHSHTHDTGQFM
jgi:hypothetical protein